MALVGEMQYLTIGNNTYSLPSGGGGTVTSVAVSNATNGGLSISGSPVTSSGTITIGHSNVLTSAQSTQAVYPITIDKNGHIASYGSAVNLEETKVFIVTLTAGSSDSYQSDKTAKQIYDAFNAGRVVLLYTEGNHILLSSVWEQDNYYQANFYRSVNSTGSFHCYEYLIITNNNVTSVEYNHYGTSVNNGTLTIQKNGTTVESFKANASSNVTANITVPTKVSDLTNDSGFVTTDEKVALTDISSAASNNGTYYLVVGNEATASTRQYDSKGISYIATYGSGLVGTCGYATLTLGNNYNHSTGGNKQGTIVLYGFESYSTTILPGETTADRTITLPNATGTLALTTDVPKIQIVRW